MTITTTTDDELIRCDQCHRLLTVERSRSRHRGPKCSRLVARLEHVELGAQQHRPNRTNAQMPNDQPQQPSCLKSVARCAGVRERMAGHTPTGCASVLCLPTRHPAVPGLRKLKPHLP